MTTAEKIAQCALKWAAAERAKKLTRRAFADAWRECMVWVRLTEFMDPEERPIFCMPEGGYGYPEWVYSEHHVHAEQRGESCAADTRWIAQRMAWLEYKAACKYAGICRAALTRMCNKVNAEGGK